MSAYIQHANYHHYSATDATEYPAPYASAPTYDQAAPHYHSYHYGGYGAEESMHASHGRSHAAGNGNQKVLAERYKTKVCKNFIETGVCPYEVRCMFAHGEHELRTSEMNFRDGLVTEDAIRHFRRMMAFKHQEEEAGIEQPPNYSESMNYLAEPLPSAAATVSPSAVIVSSPSGDSYRRNPYAWNPLATESDEEVEVEAVDQQQEVEEEEEDFHEADCECGDCLYERACKNNSNTNAYIYSGNYAAGAKTAAFDEYAEAVMP